MAFGNSQLQTWREKMQMAAKTQKRKPLVNNSVRGRYMCEEKLGKEKSFYNFKTLRLGL